MKKRRVLALIMTVAMLLSLLGPSLALAEAELLPDDALNIDLDGEAFDLSEIDDLVIWAIWTWATWSSTNRMPGPTWANRALTRRRANLTPEQRLARSGWRPVTS